MSLKIAYLVLAHKDPDHIARLCNKITINTDNYAFVHVDAKIDISSFIKVAKGNDHIRFVDDRISVNWGGFNSIEATISLFKSARSFGDFDYYQILQGLDYPIRSNNEIDSYFQKNNGKEIIRAINDTNARSIMDLYRYVLSWNFDNLNLRNKIVHKFNVVQLKIFKHLFPVKKPYLWVDGEKYDIFRGWAHFAITQNAVDYILEFNKTHAEFNEYFRYVFSSDESYFHTIIYNSKFKKNVIDGKPVEECNRNFYSYLNNTYFEYPNHRVVVFKNIDDYEKLYNTGYLFFRKATSESKELLDYIDSKHN